MHMYKLQTRYENSGGCREGDEVCPNCQTQGMLKPNIVFFGEMPKYMDEVDKMLAECDMFIAIGTSGVVYPAAGFIR